MGTMMGNFSITAGLPFITYSYNNPIIYVSYDIVIAYAALIYSNIPITIIIPINPTFKIGWSAPSKQADVGMHVLFNSA